MLARTTFSKPIKDKQVVVPRHSILERDYGRIVYLVEQGKAMKRQIVTGLSQKDLVQVISGLKGGELLIVEGHTKLAEGELVNVLN